MFGKIKEAVVGFVAKTREVVGGGLKRLGNWISGKPAVKPVVLVAPKRACTLQRVVVSRVAAMACLFIAAICLVAFNAHAAAAVDAGVQEAADSFELTFTLVKGIALTILTFAVGYKIAKRWLK